MPHSDFRKMLTIGTSPEDNELNELAKFMAKPNPSNSKTPAGYTYLSQFVDHDISFDSFARIFPWETIDLSSLQNKRDPFFNLETLYGKDAQNTSEFLEMNTPFLKLGKTKTDPASTVLQNQEIEQDLPRDSNGLATILDERNDENLLIAQTHVAFVKFHNEIAKISEGSADEKYKKARELTIRHYQYIILKDLLPKIIKESVLNDVLQNGNKFYKPDNNNIFIPLEFAVAVFRMGHSMVRNSYNLNTKQNVNLSDLQAFTGHGRFIKNLSGRKALLSDWLINWNLFFNLTGWETPPAKFNFALKISPEIASGLGDFRGKGSFHRESSIPALDLYRGRLFNLPTGQMLAETIGESSLRSSDIAKYLPNDLKNIFSVNTPLWFYILAEAQQNEDGETLGDVGSRIVAEVFVELMKQSRPSILENGLPTKLNFPYEGENFLGTADGKFGMREMLNFIETKHLEANPAVRGFLNPLGI